MPDLRYPIGHFVADPNPTPQSRALHIAQIAGIPERMRRTDPRVEEAWAVHASPVPVGVAV